ncbi:YybH family protein [Marinicella sediminis]|uniref:YybH family protein n=1 Tax=Marinicella sediminis TaxID=1792834 RepID=A0ABV7J6U7_9GAMM|nr:SgcJ/EcaC family oxidoreductase [Marinicella sediminis]
MKAVDQCLSWRFRGVLLGCVITCQLLMVTSAQTDQPCRIHPDSVFQPKDVQAIDQLLMDWKAVVQNGDLEGLAQLVTEDAEFWSHEAEPLRGRDALKQAFEPYVNTYRWQQDYQCSELIIAGDWAVIRGTEHNQFQHLTTGQQTSSRQRAFSVMQRDQTGQWRFARGMSHRPPASESE